MPIVKETPEPVSVFNMSFKVPATPDNKTLLKDLQIMAARDGDSFSEIVRKALQEYHKRHSPGNPQLVLGHWSENYPMPQTVQDRAVKPEPLAEKRWAWLNKMSDDELRKRRDLLKERRGTVSELTDISIILKSREKPQK